MEQTLLLSRGDIAASLTMPKCIELVGRVFKAHGQGNAVMPPKLKLIMAEADGWINAMPGYLTDINAAGLKWAGGWANNPSCGMPYIMAEMFLIDPETGRLKAVLEAGYITNLRTGALYHPRLYFPKTYDLHTGKRYIRRSVKGDLQIQRWTSIKNISDA
jgi:ornithine cyclodeaminase/alanine dehydrogenase